MLPRNTSGTGRRQCLPARLRRLTAGRVGNRQMWNASDFADDPNDTGGVDDTLRPTEALDSDDVRNVDGEEVVDPPEQWAAAEQIAEEPEGESLDDKLAAEVPEPAAVADEQTTSITSIPVTMAGPRVKSAARPRMGIRSSRSSSEPTSRGRPAAPSPRARRPSLSRRRQRVSAPPQTRGQRRCRSPAATPHRNRLKEARIRSVRSAR
jgi:hypothetical protein